MPKTLGALGGMAPIRHRVGVDCPPVEVANVHYDSEDPTKGPATFLCEVVPYFDGPFAYGVDREGPSRGICYQVPADQGPYLVDSLMGVGDFSNPIHLHPAPHQYPDNEALLCTSAHLHTLVGGAMSGRFVQTSRYAKISATYGKIPWSALGTEWAGFLGMSVPWTYVDIEDGYELKTVQRAANAAGDNLRQVHWTVPVSTYVFRRTMIPDFVDYDGIAQALVGRVNSGTWFGKATGTVKFESYNMREEERDPGGARVFTFSALFRWREVSWNYEPRDGYFRVWSQVNDAGSQQPFATANFLPLLTYGLV